MAGPVRVDDGAGWVPRPDPTALTTDQLRREITALRELLETQLEDKIHLVRELFDEKFRGIETRLAERDNQTEKAARDVKSAMDAAFAGAKEAVGEQNKSNALSITKSETTFTKNVDQLSELVKTLGKGLEDKIADTKKTADDKIDDIKSRVVAIESHSKGIGDFGGWIATAVTSIWAIGATIALVAGVLHH